MEPWKKAWRVGVAPTLSTAGLHALRVALVTGDRRLKRGVTTVPPPLACIRDFPCEAACAVGFAEWQGRGLETVGEISDHFGDVCEAADELLGEPAGVRHFINAHDDWSDREMVELFLPEVERALVGRGEVLEPIGEEAACSS